MPTGTIEELSLHFETTSRIDFRSRVNLTRLVAFIYKCRDAKYPVDVVAEYIETYIESAEMDEWVALDSIEDFHQQRAARDGSAETSERDPLVFG